MHWCVGVEAAGKNWQFNKTGNSTKVEIQQNGKFNKKWKFSKTGNSRKFQCVLLAISPHPFYKSGMAVSVHSLLSLQRKKTYCWTKE